MASPTDPQPVPPHRLHEAVRFLVGGGDQHVAAAGRADRMLAMAQGGRAGCYWVRRGERPLAVAMSIDRPGRYAMLVHSRLTPRAAGPLRQAVRVAVRSALERGMAFVQAVSPSENDPNVAVLTDAGLDLLACLETMCLDIPAATGDALPCGDRLGWREALSVDAKALGQLLTATYEQSLDCPGLIGLRKADDILAGHRATGRFTPQTWWIVDLDGRPAGVCLLSDAIDDRLATVVYLGVVPLARGQGIGRAMVRQAANAARARERSAISLAVDTCNTYARQAYLAEGFRPTGRRWVYVCSGSTV